MSSRVTTQLLGYSGLLPFFGFCIGFSVMEDWPRSLSIQGFIIYSLAIFAFLAGALWGQEQRVESASSVSTLLVSNGLVLFGVASILTAQAMMASVSGNTMFLDYVLTIQMSDGNIDVAVDDRMYLVSENVLINESTLKKFGLPVGGILLTIIRYPHEPVICPAE